jgi:hypothetical protein
MSSETGAISNEQARSLGVWSEHERMPNGELRFRLRNEDGSSYIRTVSSSEGGWQKSHYHVSVRETYIVQMGRIGFAELFNDRFSLRAFGPGSIFTTEPMVPHNVYMFRDSVIHTVKHGLGGLTGDWHSAPSLDQKIQGLGETEILRMAEDNLARARLMPLVKSGSRR